MRRHVFLSLLHRYSRSTPTPCVLTDIFVRFAATPKKNNPAASSQKDPALSLIHIFLAAFCGLRRSACVRITPDAILDEKDEVFVSASIAKTGKQRFVPLDVYKRQGVN